MGTWCLLVVLLISSAASLEKKCPSNILKKFLSDPSKAKELYDKGETISVTCQADSGDDGYDYTSFDGSDGLDTKNIRVLTCTDGKWIGHYPECFSNCSKPDIYAILNPEYDLYAPGDNVTVTACKKDNARIEGDTRLICMADGTWIGRARCPKQHRSCNRQPPTISNAYITDAVLDEYKHGTVLRYKCSQAFDQMKKYTVTCNDGQWIPDSANRIICNIGHCSHIYSQDISNMRVTKISGEVGTYAEFECYHGYELDGSAKILCMADRKWHPEIPKCKPISCPPPKQILNGRLIQEAYNGLLNIYQSTIRYDCDKGYRIVGPRFRKCQSDRTWSGNDTNCEEIVCEKPSNPENGKVYRTDNSEKVGSQIEYICDENHILEPLTSQFAICTELGHWSSPQPRCRKICKVPALSNGSMIPGYLRKTKEYFYVYDNYELYFICNDGYETYASGYESRGRLKCVNGALLPGSPECRPKRCFIAPKTNLGYFIGQEKLFENYIHSGIVMNARCFNKTELFVSSSYLEREQLNVKCYLGKLDSESPVCKGKRCKIITTIDNGHFINSGNVVVTGEKILSGSNIQLKCYKGYELYNKTNSMYLKLNQIDIKCYQGSFTSEIPSCEPKRCFIEPTNNMEYFIGQEKILENYTRSGIVMNARCSNKTELFHSSSYLEQEQVNVKCNLGTLEPESPVCKDKRCNIITTIDNGQFINSGKDVTEEKIVSGSNMTLICFEGYELYNKTNSTYLDLEQTDIKCYQGSFTSEIPSCEPKRCLIEPPVNMEYLIEGNTVSPKYIDNGTVMQARCPDRMELVLSSSYLDNETSVQCILGTLEPRTLECKGKRCNITQTENGKLVKGENVIDPRDMIESKSNITLVCYDGFELYNESISMYLESEKTDILCYEGSFNVVFPKCNPKRCRLDKSLLLLPGVHYVEHGQNLTVQCPGNMELHLEGNYQKLEETSIFCNKGIWTPTLPMCIKKSCKPPVLTEAVTGFVGKGNKSTPDSYFLHDQSVEAVCKDGYRQQGILTCQEGVWTGSSTCEPEVCNEPDFHFLVVKNGTLVKEDILFSHRTKLNASCGILYTLHADKDSGRNDTWTECIHGEWKPKFSCKLMCKTIDVGREIIGFIVSETKTKPGEFVPHNQSIEIVCDEGYRPHGIFRCNSGVWMGNSTCELEMGKTVDVAREITGFIVSETKTTPGEFAPHNQSIETLCGEGYRPHGILTCNAGIWRGNSTFKPDVKGCVLKDQGMYFISLGNRTVLKVGEKSNVTCKFGYQIVPNVLATRAYEYDYSDSESTADPSEMPETGDNEILIAVSDGNYLCKENGTLEPELRFSCKQIVCDSFDEYNLENGDIIYSSHYDYTVGTVASFRCDPGYTRHGPETRTCQIDGTWSGQCVTCQKNTHNASNTCPEPCVPVGARKTGSFPYAIGSRVEFHCPRSKMQDIEARSRILNCIKRGQYASWHGTKINCKETICDKGDHYGFENGRVIYSSSIATVGTEASFICNPGYNLHGNKTRICQKDGTWSPGCVTCQKHQHNSSTCPAPCVPDGARKDGSLSYEIGSRIQLYCIQSNTHYNVESSYTRHCVNNGISTQWNGSNINCKAKCEPLTDSYIVIKNGVVPGILSDKTVVELNCSRSQAPVQAECRKGSWKPTKPTCESTCEPLIDMYNIVQYGVVPGILSDKTVVELNCSRSPPFYMKKAECRNGRWNPKKPTCEYTCSLTPGKGTLYRYKVTKEQVFQGPIASGRQIKVTCEDGFFPNKQNYDVSRCVNGFWRPEIVTCEKTVTCSLSPVKGTLYSYNVTKEQVFQGPIESGRHIKVTCEDGFFPNKQNYDVSKCVNGVWTPEIVKCEKMTTQSMLGL